MATNDLQVPLATDSTWTEICGPSLTNVQLVCLPNGYEILLSDSLPDPDTPGTFVTAADGSWASSGLDTDDIVYARPLVGITSVRPALIVTGFWN